MQLSNSRQAYGWLAIGLHWISAAGVIALYFLGEGIEEAPDRAAEHAAQQLHVSVAVLLFTFLAARLLWSVSQPKPSSVERNIMFKWAARIVQTLFLLMILVLLITGPLSIWAGGKPIEVFGVAILPSPFPSGAHDLHEFAEEVHEAATKLLWPLLILHVGGALKHLVLDRDGTMKRMLWVQNARG